MDMHTMLKELGVEETTLSETEKGTLGEQGYIVFEELIGKEQLALLRDRYEDLMAKAAGTIAHQRENGTRRLFDLENQGPEFDAVYTMPKVLAAVAHLIGREFRFVTLNGRDAVRDEGLSIVDYCRKFAGAVAKQYHVFAPDGGVDVALRRLAEDVSFFGLQSEFEQFVESLGRLLGLPINPYKMLNMTASSAAGVTQDEISELQSLFADDIAFYNRAVEIYHERLTKMPKLTAEHPWTRFYS